jgi:hypothetical protein
MYFGVLNQSSTHYSYKCNAAKDVIFIISNRRWKKNPRLYFTGVLCANGVDCLLKEKDFNDRCSTSTQYFEIVLTITFFW